MRNYKIKERRFFDCSEVMGSAIRQAKVFMTTYWVEKAHFGSHIPQHLDEVGKTLAVSIFRTGC